jgi:hypothetical protein
VYTIWISVVGVIAEEWAKVLSVSNWYVGILYFINIHYWK